MSKLFCWIGAHYFVHDRRLPTPLYVCASCGTIRICDVCAKHPGTHPIDDHTQTAEGATLSTDE